MNISGLNTSMYNDFISTKDTNQKKGKFCGLMTGAMGSGYFIGKVAESRVVKEYIRPSVRNEFRCSAADIRKARFKACGKLALLSFVPVVGTYVAMKIGGKIGSLFDK